MNSHLPIAVEEVVPDGEAVEDMVAAEDTEVETEDMEADSPTTLAVLGWSAKTDLKPSTDIQNNCQPRFFLNQHLIIPI